MAILDADLKLVKAAVNDDSVNNGGSITNVEINDNLFPDVNGAERDAGLTRYRKAFLKNEQYTGAIPNEVINQTLLDAKSFLKQITAAEDHFLARAAVGQIDTQSAISALTGWSGVGFIDADVSAAAVAVRLRAEVDVTVGEVFIVGHKLLLHDIDGNKEFITIDAVTIDPDTGGDNKLVEIDCTSTPLVNSYRRGYPIQVGVYESEVDSHTDDTFTISAATLPTPNGLAGRIAHVKSGTGIDQYRRIVSNTGNEVTVEYGWTVDLVDTGGGSPSVIEILDGMGCDCIPLGDVVAVKDQTPYHGGLGYNHVASETGIYDFNELLVSPIGAVDDTWTITFTDAANFNISAQNTPGSWTGSVSAGAKPTNGSSYYFNLAAAGFDAGTWAAGDEIKFDTVSAGGAFWVKEVIAAAATPHLANRLYIGGAGDSV